MTVEQLIAELQKQQPKTDVVGWYREDDFPYSVDRVSLSCYRGPDRPDDVCVVLHLDNDD